MLEAMASAALVTFNELSSEHRLPQKPLVLAHLATEQPFQTWVPERKVFLASAEASKHTHSHCAHAIMTSMPLHGMQMSAPEHFTLSTTPLAWTLTEQAEERPWSARLSSMSCFARR